jgi:hypothetical protein
MTDADYDRARPQNAIGIALVAASVLAYQIVLMRVFAIESYASFGSMVISVALLGFGLSGTLLTVFREAVLRHRDAWLTGTAILSVPLLVGAHFLQQSVPFVPGKMIADGDHAYWLLAYYGLALIPMLAQSLFIGVTLVGFTRDVHRLYFADLAASGVGAFAVLGLFYVVHPRLLLVIPVGLVGLAAVVVARQLWSRLVAAGALAAMTAVIALYGSVEFNEYKGILGALRTVETSGAHIIDERYGPYGYLQLVESRAERTAPGLSAGTPMGISPPEQYALFVDGEKVGSLARGLSGDESKYLDWMISGLPYVLRPKADTLALQIAGGEAVAEAVHHGSPRVLGVTSNPQFIDLMRDHAAYTKGWLDAPGVELVVGDGRAIAHQNTGAFDLVMLRDLDASGLSATSTPGLSETYPLTVEAFQAYIGALKPGGLVAVTMRLSVPPYNGIRLIPTAAAALRGLGITDVADKVVFVRDTFLGLCLISPSGFTPAQVDTIRAWSRQRSFDLSWVPGLRDDDINQYTVIPVESYTELARAVLTGKDEGQAFFESYMYGIAATTDDRPYFADVVRWSTPKKLREYQEASMAALDAEEAVPSGDPGGEAIPSGDPGGEAIPSGDPTGEAIPSGDPTGEAIPSGDPTDQPPPSDPAATLGAPATTGAPNTAASGPDEEGVLAALRQLPVELWSGYLQWFTLAQALAFGALIIIIPLFGARRGVRGVPGKAKAFIYFACLGVGFMLGEMVLIRKLTLFLASPTIATTVVLAAILLFSGLGSGASGRATDPKKAIRLATIVVVLTVLFDAFALDPILRALLGLPAFARALIAVLAVAPTAFFLGYYFPTALETLGRDPERAPLVPWAWAVNGATSVVAAVLGEILSVHLGFRFVLGLVVLCYLLALATFPASKPRAAT